MTGHETQRSLPDGEDDDDEDGKVTVPPVCECNSCPDLTGEVFSRCCQSLRKAKELCSNSEISCICDSLKLGKLLDKARSKLYFCCC